MSFDRHVFHGHSEHDDRGNMGGGGQRGVHSRLGPGPKQVGFVDGPRGGHISKRRFIPRGGGGGAGGLSNAAAAAFLPDDDVVFDNQKRSEQAGRGRPVFGRKNWRSMQRRGGPGRTPPGIVEWE